MKNAVFPPVSSQMYNFGTNEVQMPYFDIPMDSKLMYMEPFDEDKMKLTSEIFAIPHQQYPSAHQFISSSWENYSAQPRMDKVPAPFDAEFQFTTMSRKRSIEGINSLIRIENVDDQKKSKRRKAASPLELLHKQVRESSNFNGQKLKVPARRSQKLSDKITALQKLVSPYGKTDTASVLQEASLYIKILQEQIQNIFQKLNKSSPSQKIDGKLQDIQSRGLCLFPISVAKNLHQDDYC